MSDLKSTAKLPKPKRGKLRPLLLSFLIFFCGMIVGGGLVTGVFGHFIHSSKYPEKIVNHIIGKIDRRLDLDDEQLAQVERIINERNRNLQNIRKTIGPQIQNEILTAHRQIRAVLNPEQQKKWDKWFNKIRRRWKKRLPFRLPAPDSASPDKADHEPDD